MRLSAEPVGFRRGRQTPRSSGVGVMGSHEPCGMLGTEFWSSACTVRLSLELALLSILLPYTPWVVLFLVCLFLSFVFVSLCISGFLELAL